MRFGSTPPNAAIQPWLAVDELAPAALQYSRRNTVAYRTQAEQHPGLLQCLTCWRWLQPEWFYRCSTVASGRRSLCKECEWRRYCLGKRRPRRYEALGPTLESERDEA